MRILAEMCVKRRQQWLKWLTNFLTGVNNGLEKWQLVKNDIP